MDQFMTIDENQHLDIVKLKMKIYIVSYKDE